MEATLKSAKLVKYLTFVSSAVEGTTSKERSLFYLVVTNFCVFFNSTTTTIWTHCHVLNATQFDRHLKPILLQFVLYHCRTSFF